MGCDASSLKLKEFKLLTTQSNNSALTDLLKEHYLYESIKRIGWVAGSLEFIGSSAGLIRNVKKGIEDFVHLPIADSKNVPTKSYAFETNENRDISSK